MVTLYLSVAYYVLVPKENIYTAMQFFSSVLNTKQVLRCANSASVQDPVSRGMQSVSQIVLIIAFSEFMYCK